MERYTPTIEEVKESIDNARQILEQLFIHVTDEDVFRFRELMRRKLNKLYRERNKQIKEERCVTYTHK